MTQCNQNYFQTTGWQKAVSYTHLDQTVLCVREKKKKKKGKNACKGSKHVKRNGRNSEGGMK